MRSLLLGVIMSLGLIASSNAQNIDVPNGIYLILNEYEQEPKSVSGRSVVPFSHDFLGDNVNGQPLFLEIESDEYVPLDLATKPEGIPQEDKRLNLMLTLTENGKNHLAKFTEKNLNKRVAIVIGNKAVTKHKVRTVIDGGKLQITRCTDNACEHLLLELEGNVKE